MKDIFNPRSAIFVSSFHHLVFLSEGTEIAESHVTVYKYMPCANSHVSRALDNEFAYKRLSLFTGIFLFPNASCY